MPQRITKAVQQDEYIELEIIDLNSAGQEVGEPYPYVLYPADPYGTAPVLRAQLEYLVSNGEIVIEAPGG